MANEWRDRRFFNFLSRDSDYSRFDRLEESTTTKEDKRMSVATSSLQSAYSLLPIDGGALHTWQCIIRCSLFQTPGDTSVNEIAKHHVRSCATCCLSALADASYFSC